MPSKLTLVLVLGFLLFQGVANAADVIGQLTDPEDPAIPEYLDIISARVEQDRGMLTFYIETRGNIPTTLPLPEDGLTFLWLVDADNDPNTGQPYPNLGSDFNIRAVIGATYGGGYVDVPGTMPGGGTGTVTVQGNVVKIVVGLSQISSPPQFHWLCSSFQISSGSYVAGNSLTEIVLSETVPFTPPARVTVTTPLLMLSPSGTAAGQLGFEIRDKLGNLMPNSGYTFSLTSSNPAVATVDGTGLVTVLSTPVEFDDTPVVTASADGVTADNVAVIRSTASDLPVQHQMYSAQHVAFYLPPSIEGVNLDQLTSDYGVAETTDLAYRVMRRGIATKPFNGGVQYFALDVSDDPNTVPCGISGNPIRLGWEYGKATDNSCYIVNVPGNRIPQWFVIFHELGHNFLGHSVPFNQFWSAQTQQDSAYSEGIASLAALWSQLVLSRYPSRLSSLGNSSLADNYSNSESWFRYNLATYQSGGSQYSQIDANVVDGILFEMLDLYGEKAWIGLFSSFLPVDEPLPFSINTPELQATWLVAALSAAAGTDLRSRFAANYGFPIDSAAWADMLAEAAGRIEKRPWQQCMNPLSAMPSDFDGDLSADVAVYRPIPGIWYLLSSAVAGTYKSVPWGTTDDQTVPGDYGGDGKIDIAVWRPSTGVWYILSSESPGTYSATQWGLDTDKAVPGDYDGDGKTDIAVWRPDTGVWYILPSGSPGSYSATQWGLNTDVPAPGDYDGDGKPDIAVWRPSTGVWYILSSESPGTYSATQWGLDTDKAVPGNYDGDGKTDIAVWRPDTGVWYILPSGSPGSYSATQWGLNTDVPAPGDYDGDGKADIAVWRPSTGVWYILPSGSPGSYSATQWGLDTDLPISAISSLLRLLP